MSKAENLYIGLDIGTSSVKAMLTSDCEIINVVSLDYPVFYPQPGWSEQNPLDWYEKSLEAIEKLTADADRALVRSIAFSGQMHGLVMLDKNDNVVRPAILWNDGRSEKEVAYLNGTVGRDFLLDNTGNIAFAGFTAPKVMWVYNNERDNFDKTAKICLPKDYVAYRLSGVFATDASDAAGTLYFDTAERRWSKPMLDLLKIDETYLPKVLESSSCSGTLLPEIADRLGFDRGVKVVIGAGDNAASAIGVGAVNDGDCNISLGTSGTVFVCSDRFNCDRVNALHSFCSANGKFHYLACTLAAASAQKWWIEDILGSDYGYDPSAFAGRSEVLFLPYLMGERSPVNDTSVRGMFSGLSMSTGRDEMSLAVLEGVAFSLRHNLDIIRALGVDISKSRICGGGTKNKFWLKLIATILGISLEIPVLEHGGVLGACILAAEGTGKSIGENFYGVKETVEPDLSLRDFYNKKYEKYLKMYAAASMLK